MQGNYSDIDVAGVLAGFGALCGGLAYGTSLAEGRGFSLKRCLLNLATSATCSFFVGEAMLDYSVPLGATLALSGMAGWMGPHLPELIETVFARIVLRRAGITAKEDEK